ncbi:PIN domain-containing protein [Methylobacterium sp. SyP6R]|uniref:PIN domain-containing protein n=1 Tax=Methylobacterium sp. SyP6R TaxID=2718876 RepID=UPI001F2FEE35|nr:PIN domain-containing protein [Methylobacterium sp. SyP6R]MCF4127069.1 PIN domain-containing protein [Methylobacterium sp. SyP6R]
MIVVGTNIILGVILGRRSRPAFETVQVCRKLVTSARAVDEVRGVLRDLPGARGETIAQAETLLSSLTVIEAYAYDEQLPEAARVLSQAVASRNGSTSDAHLLACAWLLDADIWSHDRDFAGTGWPSWSNANLLRALDGP